MPVSPSIRLAALFALLSMAAAGCVTSPVDAKTTSWWPNQYRKADAGPVRLKDREKVQVAYGQWSERSGQTKEARQAYSDALQKNPKSLEAMLGMARLDALSGRYDEAEQQINKAAKLAPNHPMVRATRGTLYLAKENYRDAIVEFRAAVESDATDPTYRYQLGTALARSGDIDGALREFTKGQGPAVAHYNVGYILYEQGSFAAAETHFARALQHDPTLKPATQMLASCRAEQPGRNLAQSPNGGKVLQAGGYSLGPSTPENGAFRDTAVAAPELGDGITDIQREQMANQLQRKPSRQ